MDWSALLAFTLGGLVALMLTGLPVFACFLALNLGAAVLLMGPVSGGLFVNSLINTASSNTLAPIPLFLLMGELLFRSGSVGVLFDAVDKLVGRIPGRLYVVVIALSTIFGALSGSAIAVAAMLGRSVYPGMRDRGYDPRFSASVILLGSCLAPIIPPSLLAVIIGSLADVSIASLLIAGVIPGLLIAVMALVYIFARTKIAGEATEPSTDCEHDDGIGMRDRLRALLQMAPFSLVIFAVMGLILLGVATPSEAAGTGVAGALAVAALYRKLSLKMVAEAVLSTAKISATILLIIASSVLFSQLLAISGASTGLIRWVTELDLSRWLLIVLLMLVPLFLCMFVDQIAFLLAAIPLYLPIVRLLDVDPVWFWTLFAINLTIGTITPPFGYTLFALRAAGPPSLTTQLVFAASRPVIAILVVSLIILGLVPELVTVLPKAIR